MIYGPPTLLFHMWLLSQPARPLSRPESQGEA